MKTTIIMSFILTCNLCFAVDADKKSETTRKTPKCSMVKAKDDSKKKVSQRD